MSRYVHRWIGPSTVRDTISLPGLKVFACSISDEMSNGRSCIRPSMELSSDPRWRPGLRGLPCRSAPTILDYNVPRSDSGPQPADSRASAIHVPEMSEHIMSFSRVLPAVLMG